jgi:hypothetical protein
MVEERYDRNHHAGGTPEERIRNRLRPSAEPQRGTGAQVKLGDGPTRVITTVHRSGNMRQHGEDAKGVGIDGRERGPANRSGEIK